MCLIACDRCRALRASRRIAWARCWISSVMRYRKDLPWRFSCMGIAIPSQGESHHKIWSQKYTQAAQPSYQPRLGGLINTTRGRPQFCYVSEHIRSTGRADTVTGIARSSVLLTLPADTPLTPGTFDQVIALTQLDKLRSILSILRLEIAIPFAQLVSVPQHVGNRSSSKLCDSGKTL